MDTWDAGRRLDAALGRLHKAPNPGRSWLAPEALASAPPLVDGRHRPRQDEEGGLEGVLGVLLVPQHPPAHAADHRAVAVDEQFEGRLVAPGGEALQQGRVVGAVGRRQAAEQAEDRGAQRGAGHDDSGDSVSDRIDPGWEKVLQIFCSTLSTKT